jgi:hypothetical protein
METNRFNSTASIQLREADVTDCGVFRSAKVALIRGAKGDDEAVIY